MVKITGEHTASTVQNSAAKTNVGHHSGFEEQWLRALEQDHIETQMSKMHRTPYDNAPEKSIDAPVKPTAAIESCPADQSKGTVDVFETNSGVNSKTGHTSNMNIESRTLDEIGRGPKQNIRTDAFGHDGMRRQIPNTHQKSAAVRSNLDWGMVRRLLPSSSSLSILFADEGLHMVIRDASLQAADLRRILGKIRMFFASMKAQLASITLNGEAVWRCRPDMGAEGLGDITQIKQEINKTY